MFPSAGYFKDLLCPDDKCTKPHCPFWHDPNPRVATPPPPRPPSAEWAQPTYNPEVYNQFYAPGPPVFSGYNASVAASPSQLYAPQDSSVYTGYVASSSSYDPGNLHTAPSYTPTPLNNASKPPEVPPEKLPERVIKKEIKQEVEDDDVMIIEPAKKKVKKEVKEEPADEAEEPPKKRKKEPLPLPKIPSTSAAPTGNLLEAAKTVADIDAEIERLTRLREQHKQQASAHSAPPKKKRQDLEYVPKEASKPEKRNNLEYVPKEASKPEKRKAPSYTPTPLAEIERQKEEKRRKFEKEKVEVKKEAAVRRKSSSDLSVQDLFGEDIPAAPVKRRTESTENVKEKIALLKQSRPVPKPSVPAATPSTSTGVSKGAVLTAEQIAAAKQRVARPGAANITRPVTTNMKVASAVEQMKARMEAVAAQKNNNGDAVVKKPKTLEDRFGEKRSQPKGESRTSRASQVSRVSSKPELQEPSNTKVPMSIRLTYLQKMFHEFTAFLSPSEAKAPAEAEEKAVLDKVKHKQGYMVAATNALKRVRDIGQGKPVNAAGKVSHEQVLHGKAYGSITINAKGPKEDRPITEDRLYTALAENYLLTEEQMKNNSYPLWDTPDKVHIEPSPYDKKRCKKTFVPDYDLTRVCCRCTAEFQLNLKGGIVKASCIYHPKGLSRMPGKRRNNDARHPCCGSDESVAGCQMGDAHVFDTLRDSDLKKFVATPKPSGPSDPRSRKIYALDCEMVYTVWGPALARITVVDYSENSVFDEIVKPKHTVIDYNTVFSGITANQLETCTYDMEKVHERLFELVNSESILIGHSLESDLKAMRVVHNRVVDTSVLYPHRIDDQKKRGLRELCLDKLQKSIQDNIDGHDSKEDSIAALQLVVHKAKFDGKL